MSRSLSDDVLEATIQALSATSGDALAKAAAEGFPDRSEVVEWSDRMLGLVLRQRDRSALRAELPALAERFLRILATRDAGARRSTRGSSSSASSRACRRCARGSPTTSKRPSTAIPPPRATPRSSPPIRRSGPSRPTASRTSCSELGVPLVPRVMSEQRARAHRHRHPSRARRSAAASSSITAPAS